MELASIKAWGPALVKLYAMERGQATPVGNGFVAAACGNWGLVITAGHSAREVRKIAIQNTPFSDVNQVAEDFVGSIEYFHGAFLAGGSCQFHKGLFWEDESGNDLAVLLARADNGSSLSLAFQLFIGSLTVGEVVQIIGARQVSDPSTPPPTQIEIHLEHRGATVVSADYMNPNQQNFRISQELEHGMSGSPAICFRQDVPMVCGVLSKSLTNGPSTFATLGPLLSVRIPWYQNFESFLAHETIETTMSDLSMQDKVSFIHE